MAMNKYKAVWVSHSSMGDFIKCPRLYFLHNIYKDPKTNRKITIVTPYMSLGIAVHNVLEGLGNYPANERMTQDLRAMFEEEWLKITGKKGGFENDAQEEEFKIRGKEMINVAIKNPRFLVNKRIKLPQSNMPCNFYLSEEDNIILNGLIDWLEYLPDDTLHVIDFKTGKHEEKESSLQLPIYLLLCNALQKRTVSKASYWYLDGDRVVEKALPDLESARKDVYSVAIKVKVARDKKEFACKEGKDGCMHCKVYEEILLLTNGKPSRAEYIGVGGFNQDVYIINKQ